MENFAQISTAFVERKAVEKKILNGAKILKVYEVTSKVPTNEGVKLHVELIKSVCPKSALKIQRERFTDKDVKVYDIKTVVAPTNKRGYIAYEVFKNAHIIR